MNRPPLEVADVIRAAGSAFLERARMYFDRQHWKALNAILHCRTAALGGHIDQCSGCGKLVLSYAKRPFGGPEHVLQYLGNYTHRIAISNHRLLGLEDDKISFRWRDSAHKNKQRVMALRLDEFLRRYFLHVLPPGFVRIRHFGLFANRLRKYPSKPAADC